MVQEHASSVVLTESEYDVYSVSRLERELAELDASRTTIDMGHVQYLDMACLGAMVRTLKRLRLMDPSSTLHLTNTQRPIRRVFQITHLDDVFDVS